MGKEYVTSRLIEVDQEYLTLEPGFTAKGWWVVTGETVKYPHAGINIKANWVKRFLGTKVRCRVFDNVIRSISRSR